MGFHSEAFKTACARQSLPLFSLSMASNAWEKDFLTSLAAFITPGAPHAWKTQANLEGKRASDKQREILGKIVHKAAQRGGKGGAGAGGGGV